MELLSHSSSFFGVLVTLVVLCVFANNNNFIHTILKSIKDDQIKPQIDKLEIDTDFQSVKQTTDYKIFQKAIKGEDGYCLKPEQMKQALSLDLEIQAEFDKFRGTLTPTILKPAYDTLETIKQSKEQVMAPLYSLLVCLAVFVCDEILHVIPFSRDILITFLSTLIFISYFFWGVIWFSLWRDTYNSLIVTKKPNRFTYKLKNLVKFCERINYRKGLRLLIEIDIIVILTIVLCAINPVWIRITLYATSLLIPLFAIAAYRVSRHSNLGIYSYDFLFKHFCVISLLSLMVTMTFAIGASHHILVDEMLFGYENCNLLKYSILVFIILNGLILPFIMPYWGYKYVLEFAKHKTQNIEKIVEPIRTDIIQKLKNMSNGIIQSPKKSEGQNSK